jgi:hypothetical protein
LFEKILANSKRSLHFHTQISSYITKLNHATTDYILLRNEEKKKLIEELESNVIPEELKITPEINDPKETIEGDPTSCVLLGYKGAVSYTFLIAAFGKQENDYPIAHPIWESNKSEMSDVITVENFNSKSLRINSPRSIDACRRKGIKPQELQYLTLDEFKQRELAVNLPPAILKLRREHYEKSRGNKVKALKNERQKIIEEEKAGI